MSALTTVVAAGVSPAGGAPGHPATGGRRLSGWLGFAVRRLGGLVLAGAVLVVTTFLIVPLIPGDPARVISGTNSSPAAVATIRAQLGLDDPIGARFLDYVSGLLSGDLGTSFRFGTPVSEVVSSRLPYTVQLALPAIVVVLLIAIPLGMTVGVLTRSGRRRWLDVGFGTLAGMFASLPAYVAATGLIVVFAIGLNLLPPGGAETANSSLLPIAALAIGPAFAVARVVRQETATVLNQDFMRTARGRRLPTHRLYLRHALPNLLTSVLTLTGLVLTSLLGGTIIVENVFNYPGLGTAVVEAIIYRDYPVIQGVILSVGALALVLNLLVDVVLGLIDPRTLEGAPDA